MKRILIIVIGLVTSVSLSACGSPSHTSSLASRYAQPTTHNPKAYCTQDLTEWSGWSHATLKGWFANTENANLMEADLLQNWGASLPTPIWRWAQEYPVYKNLPTPQSECEQLIATGQEVLSMPSPPVTQSFVDGWNFVATDGATGNDTNVFGRNYQSDANICSEPIEFNFKDPKSNSKLAMQGCLAGVEYFESLDNYPPEIWLSSAVSVNTTTSTSPQESLSGCESTISKWVDWYASIALTPQVGSANQEINSALGSDQSSSGQGGTINLAAWVQVQALQPGGVQPIASECSALISAGVNVNDLPEAP